MDPNAEPTSLTSVELVRVPSSEATTDPPKRPDPEVLKEWEKIQDELRHKIITQDTEAWQTDLTKLKLVGGLDISYPKDAHSQSSCTVFTAIVICSFPELEIVYQDVQKVELLVPYVAGFLAFRESSALLKLVEKVMLESPEFTPDVLLVDGNGILHPQQCGLACHIGYYSGIPTIGVAKNLFHLDGIKTEKNVLQTLTKAGEFIYIRDNNARILGMALKTGDEAINPAYVSVGHKISLESSRNIVLAVCKFRVPEPIRFADAISREFVRNSDPKLTSSTKKGKSKVVN